MLLVIIAPSKANELNLSETKKAGPKAGPEFPIPKFFTGFAVLRRFSFFRLFFL
jgi:hypothetical protein